MKMLYRKSIGLLVELLFVLALIGFANANGEQNHTVIMDDNSTFTITNGYPLIFKEGYQMNLTSPNPKSKDVFAELSKEGQVLMTKQIDSGDTMDSGDTFDYKKDLGDGENVTILQVHFKNVFHGAGDTIIATIDRIWQMSET